MLSFFEVYRLRGNFSGMIKVFFGSLLFRVRVCAFSCVRVLLLSIRIISWHSFAGGVSGELGTVPPYYASSSFVALSCGVSALRTD